MKWRTNRQRLARKLRKAQEIKTKESKQLHVNYDQNLGYHDIIGSVKTGSSVLVLRNQHSKKKIEKKVLYPKVLWNQGTYIRKEHGKLRKS